MSIRNCDSSMPWLTTEQMVEVDRLMIEDLGIELIQMMENAGRNLAHLARERFLGGDPTGKTVVVLAGTGGNVGELYLADVGVPPSLYTSPSLALPPVGPLFATGDIVRLT